MATTTNYSWETPDDTDLVKDGAAAIRTLGSSIDTTTKALNPSTTLGDIEYRSSTANTNTRLGIGSTGNVLTVTGGVPVWAAPAGGFGTWAAYTPTWSNLTVGNGTVVARYVQNGKVVNFYIDLTWGSTTSASGAWTVNWPVTPASNDAARGALVNVWINDVSFSDFLGLVRSHVSTTTTLSLAYGSTNSTFLIASGLTATAPMTWVTSDRILIQGTYEVA
jgi:hypothetical protein